MSRPRIDKDKHREDITLTLPQGLIGAAKAYAAFGGMTVSGWVEELLKESISRIEKAMSTDRMEPYATCECGRKCGSKRSWIAHKAVCKVYRQSIRDDQ